MMSPQDNDPSVTLHLDGLPENNSELRLSVFIEKLTALREALREADRFLSGKNSLAMLAEFYVEGLEKHSPSAVTVREHVKSLFDVRPISASRLITDTLSALTISADAVNEPIFPVLEKLKDLGEGLGRKCSRIWFSRNGEVVASITPETYANILELLKGTIASVGSVIGRVERYNSHGDSKYFYIYPNLGGRIRCNFPDNLLQQAASAVEKRVIVYGTLRYREGAFQAHEVDMTQMEVIEMTSEEEAKILPDLYGVAPNATGEESSIDFIKRIRDGWNQ